MSLHLTLFFVILVVVKGQELRSDREYWTTLAQQELSEALKVQWNVNTAKNVILFIGDGMGPNTVTATRIYKGGESHQLAFEKFPHVGMLKTYSANKMVPDSASSGTAMLCGVKVNHKTVGVDASVQHEDCASSLQQEKQLSSLAADALNAGKSAGFVTTMRVTHSTPGPLYAHIPDWYWECEDNITPGNEQCKDVARQLVEDWPGRDLQVILGGGKQMLVSNSPGTESDPINTWSCKRQDGRNLTETYVQDKESRGLRYSVVHNNADLNAVNFWNTDYLFGVFANGHLPYEFQRNPGPDGKPSLSEMTQAALRILQKNSNGYFLMVEGGNIDMAHHRGRARTSLDEVIAFEQAVELALSMTDESETLIVVTADHGFTLSINGYPDRGSDIFGIAEASVYDGTNYTTLSYATGGPGAMHYYTGEDGEVKRRDPSTEDTRDYYYEQLAAVRQDANGHGGGDTPVYAKGPFSHLFHNIHEQHYVYHAISYAAKLGAYGRPRSDLLSKLSNSDGNSRN